MRRRLGCGNTPLTNTLSSDLLDASDGSEVKSLLKVHGKAQVIEGVQGLITTPKYNVFELSKARERASAQCYVTECTLTRARSGLT
jgi:hypothetical protein